MKAIKEYFWKYSSYTHVALLAAVAVVLLVSGNNIMGEDYTVVYPVAAVIVALLEVVALKTKPTKS